MQGLYLAPPTSMQDLQHKMASQHRELPRDAITLDNEIGMVTVLCVFYVILVAIIYIIVVLYESFYFFYFNYLANRSW